MLPNSLILDGNQMRMLLFPFSLVLVSDNHKIWSNSPPTKGLLFFNGSWQFFPLPYHFLQVASHKRVNFLRACLTSTRSRVCKAQWPCFVWGRRASRRSQWQNACSDRPLWWCWGLSRSLWLGSLSPRIRNGTPNSLAGKIGTTKSELRVGPHHKSTIQNVYLKNDSYPLKLLSLTQEDQPYNHICRNNIQITKKFWQNSSDGTERILEKNENICHRKFGCDETSWIWLTRLFWSLNWTQQNMYWHLWFQLFW